MTRLGLVSVSFRKNTTAQILAACRRAGLSRIEWGSDIHAPVGDEDNLRRLSELCRREQIEICSYGTYFRLGQTPLTALPQYIAAAKTLGTDILRLWCGTKGYHTYAASEFSALIGECRAAAKLAQENGVTLCMECHNGTVTDCVEGALRLMRAVDSPHFRMYWQPNQYRTPAENESYARQIAPYTTHIHVFHWVGDHRYPLGDGIADWQRYLAALPGDHTLLLEFMPDDAIESLEKEAEALRRIVGDKR